MYGECLGQHNSMESEVLDTCMESVWDNITLWRVRY